MFSQSRISQRIVPTHLGFIQIFGDDGGRILNISESGLSFESFAPLGEAQTLQFWFSLNLRDRIEAMGQVVWLDSGTKVGGLRFVNPSNQAIQHIRHYSKETRQNGTIKRGALFADILAKQKAKEPSKAAAPTVNDTPNPQAFDSTELISWQRHKEECRKRFVLGLALGLFLASTATVAAYRFWMPRPPQAATANESKPSAFPGSSPSNTVFPASPVSQTIAPAPKRSSAAASRIPPTTLTGAKLSKELPSLNVSTQGSAAVMATGVSAPQLQSSTKKPASSEQLWSSVQAGDTNAAVILADRYLHGDGVPANCLQARVLLLVASEKKNADAIKKLDELDKVGCPADPKQ